VHGIDFSSWRSLFMVLIGLALFTLISVGIYVLTAFTIQRRHERSTREINERMRALIAAYKTLNSSDTGTLTVDSTNPLNLHRQGPTVDRMIEIEGALSDIILLGTVEQVRLAVRAVHDLLNGGLVRTNELTASLRQSIREELNIGPAPSN